MVNENLKRIISRIKKFRDDRDWMQFHDPKNMAISIILEASELLEHFQWKTKKEVEEYIRLHRQQIKEEIADIAMYLFELSDNLKIDLVSAMDKKMEKNEQKYPLNKSKGNARKYDQL